MRISDQVYEEALKVAADHAVSDIRIGIGYTAAQLDDGRCGLAFTLHEKEYESCTVIPEAGTLAGRQASELVSWIRTNDETACAVGMATVNALSTPPPEAVESDILEKIPIAAEDAVGMIGYFGPLVEKIKTSSRALHIFERKPIPELGVLPDTATADLLPQCQVVIISGTALLNQTIDGILDLCAQAKEIAILGPSTPFLPGPFKKRRVTLLSGIHVTDPAKALKVVSEAGGTRSFGSAIRKLTLRIPQ